MKSHAKQHFKKVDPRLYKAFEKLDGDARLSPEKVGNHFARMCRIIVGQQLSGKAANSIYARFESLFLRKNVTAKKILSFSDDEIRGVGMSYSKVNSLKDLSQKVVSKTTNLKLTQEMSNEEVFDHLILIKGVGPWSIEMFLMFGLGREDVFAYGDLGLQKGIQKIYKLKNKPTQKQMESITRKWAPYRTYASLILWRHVDDD